MPSSAKSAPITVRADVEVIAEIDRIAAQAERSRNWVVNRVLRQYVDDHARLAERIAESIGQADAGDVEDAEIVHKRIAVKHGWTLD